VFGLRSQDAPTKGGRVTRETLVYWFCIGVAAEALVTAVFT
jgi:hypothetical protein